MIYIIILILAIVCIISGKVNKPPDKHKRKKAPAAKAGAHAAKHPQTDAAINESLLFIDDLLQDEQNPEKIYKLLQRKIKLLKTKEDLKK